jgi:ubiquinol-cytochrome c reductase cytochrome b subunit
VHHLADRPRQRPLRTALGVAGLTFLLVLFLAGGSDVLAESFDLSVNAVLWSFRIALIVAPVLTGWTAHRLCSELLARDGLPSGSRIKLREIPARLVRGSG